MNLDAEKLQRPSRRAVLTGLAAGALYASPLRHARAQEIPSSSVRLLVGFGPGSAVDLVARALAKKLEESWTAGVVVDNRAGAGGQIAAAALGAAQPDGNTLLVGEIGSVVVAPLAYRKLQYDPKSFVPISNLVGGDVTLVIGSQVPVKTVAEWSRFVADKPAALIGTFGPGTPHHLVASMLGDAAGRKIEPVHYKAPQDVLTSLVQGDLHGAFVSSALADAWQKSGKVTVLAVSSPFRSPLLPNVATFREQGLAACEFLGWIGLFAPASTPPAIADRANRAVVSAMKSAEVVSRMQQIGYTVTAASRDAFAQELQDDRIRLGRVVTAMGLKLD